MAKIKYTTTPKYKVDSGPTDAVCFAVYDLGDQETKMFGVKHQIAFGFELDQRIEDPESEYNGKRMTKWATYTWVWAEKSNLTKQFMSWFGKVPTSLELKEGVDMDEWCLGKPATLNLVENGEYVNIQNIMKTNKNNKMVPEINSTPPSWLRNKMIDGGTWTEPGQTEPIAKEPIPEEDDLPF